MAFQGGDTAIVHRRGAVEHDRRGDDGVQPWIGQPVGKCDAAECQHGYGECGSGQYGCDGETLGVVASVCCAGCLVWIFGVIFGGFLSVKLNADAFTDPICIQLLRVVLRKIL